MNKLKIKKEILIPVLVGFLFLGVGLVMGGGSGSKLSFTDKMAKYAGTDISERLYEEIREDVIKEEEAFGGASGQDHYSHEFFNAGLSQGGTYTTSTSGTLMPLNARDIENNTYIDATLNVSDGELRFPVSSTLSSIMPNTGNTRTWIVRNASSSVDTMDLKIASSTGIIMNMASTTNMIFGGNSGGNFGRVTLTRKANTDFLGVLEIFLKN